MLVLRRSARRHGGPEKQHSLRVQDVLVSQCTPKGVIILVCDVSVTLVIIEACAQGVDQLEKSAVRWWVRTLAFFGVIRYG